ncbi:CcmD family protein [Hymenobacter sp. H14-R3]|uniref:CcmD family protein n=1 Tax=Hymenobacter sp. H14-R3 TaxID=3046308 RepID=UPI0024B9F278|nr:CcmD family protein [Hymenobacter sp. H14-R3]MDJ0363523.1 CcmD family protein [Hymenobacter sp. H14-R3]
MKNKTNNLLSRAMALLLPLLLLAGAALAQTGAADQPEMADALRANGKIYVVVLVIVIILSGLFVYLVRLDRKVSRLEREVEGR